MSKTYSPVELNTFIAGLITEASPLTFPPNASLDEENFILNKDGSRTRRNGIDLESGYVAINSGQTMPVDKNLKVSSFKWKNVGGDPQRTFIVVQIGNKLQFFDNAVQPLSTGFLSDYTYDNSEEIIRFSYANVDGTLVVVTGRKDINIFSYDGSNINLLNKRIKIRDQFGVTDIAS